MIQASHVFVSIVTYGSFAFGESLHDGPEISIASAKSTKQQISWSREVFCGLLWITKWISYPKDTVWVRKTYLKNSVSSSPYSCISPYHRLFPPCSGHWWLLVFLPCLHYFSPLQILICCMCATFTADPILALLLCHTLSLGAGWNSSGIQ